MADLDEQLDRACADGRISVHDADEVRRFADFLTDAGRPGDDGATFEAWRKHYPDDYQRALAEARARAAGGGEGDRA